MSHITVTAGGQTFQFHEKLYENLLQIKQQQKRDWDFKILVSGDGMTRIGKTTLAAQILKILDENSTEDNWIYGGHQLVPKAMGMGKGRGLIYDEAREGLNSARVMANYNQGLINYFNECGYLNQFMIIVLPDFFDLIKSIAMNLSICLINVKVNKDLERGYFDFYSRKDKKYLYVNGQKYRDYTSQRASFEGTFVKHFPYDYKILEEQKKAAIVKREDGDTLGKREYMFRERLCKLLEYLHIEEKRTLIELADVIDSEEDNINPEMLAKILENYRDRRSDTQCFATVKTGLRRRIILPQ